MIQKPFFGSGVAYVDSPGRGAGFCHLLNIKVSCCYADDEKVASRWIDVTHLYLTHEAIRDIPE
jgi:hypothetical protein